MLTKKPPAYRRKRVRGIDYAVVSWRTPDGGRIERSLGRWGTPASRQAYEIALGEWRSGVAPKRARQRRDSRSIAALSLSYTQWLAGRVRPDRLAEIKQALRLLVRHCGSLPIEDFGPVAL